MEVLITRIIEALIFPPGSLLLLLLVGLVLLKRKAGLAKLLLWSGVAIGYLISTPFFAGLLINQLQIYPALTDKDLVNTSAQAIVVLAGGRFKDAQEYGGKDTVGPSTLTRIRYGAHLHRITGLPVLVSGGNPWQDGRATLAQVMADSLKQDFSVRDVWLEDKSTTTGENALFSKEVLDENGVDTVLLVTQAWHMPRSVAIYEKAGLKVIAAPTAFIGRGEGSLRFLPNARSLHVTQFALHEIVGMLWYKIRY